MIILKKYKPTTPSRRFRKIIYLKNIKNIKTAFEKKNLLKRITSRSGRNNKGIITVRHKSSGVKRLFRIIDFKRLIPQAIIKNIVYDPNRNSYVAKIINSENLNEFSYILLPRDITLGSILKSGTFFEKLNVGDNTELRNIPIGSIVHNLEVNKFKGGQYIRTAGNFGTIVEKNLKFCRLRLSSGEQRLVNLNCTATIGAIDNEIFKRRVLGKAGASRWLGIRPTVRGVAMNPVDHPHGGGQGKTSGGRPSVTPRGLPTKGKPTRKKQNITSKKIIIFARTFKNSKKKSKRKGKYSI